MSKHWCEHCGGWDDIDHYETVTEDQGSGQHKAGARYGLFGEGLAAIRVCEAAGLEIPDEMPGVEQAEPA